MLESILKREDVLKLLREIALNNRYNKKENKDSIDYLKFVDFEQSLFIVVDALYKYSVIVEDDSLIKDYVEQLNLLVKKIDNFTDITIGVNKLLVKFTALKLGYKDKVLENRVEILNYIYKKYIEEGYLFHAINGVYLENIKQFGFIPQDYNNLYNDFAEVKEILGEDIVDKDFTSNDVSFTDSFLLAYYYGINSPMYFYNILCNNDLITKIQDKDAYMKIDYDGCLKNLNKIIYKLDLNNKKANYLRKVFDKEWNLINRKDYRPSVILVKRSLLLKDDYSKYLNIINNNDIEVYEAASKILSNKYDNVKCDFRIDSNQMEFVSLPKYGDFVKEEVKVVNNSEEDSEEFGKVSLLLLCGALLITLGVIITMIMIMIGG